MVRLIDGELILVPLGSSGGDPEDELYALNEGGRAIWERLDGVKTLGDIAAELSAEFGEPPEEVERDVCGFATELLKRGMLVQTGPR